MWTWLLGRYAAFALRRPLVLLALAGALTVAAVALLPGLRVVTSRTTLVRRDHPVQTRILRFLEEFGWHHNLIAVVQGETRERSRAFADRLAEALRRERDVVRSVFYKVDLDALKDKALLYVPLEDLRRLRAVLEAPGLQFDEFLRVRGLVPLFQEMDAKLRKGLQDGSPAAVAAGDEGIAALLRVLAAFFDELTQWMRDPGRTRFDVLERLYLKRFARDRSALDERGYFAGTDGRTTFLFVHPVQEDDSAETQIPFTTRVREVVARERTAFGGKLDVGVTGMPATIADEMSTIERDMTVVSLVAFFGIAALYLFVYRFSIRIVLALLPIMAGTLWTFGFASAAVGHLNLLSSVFSAVLFGLGDDFGIHLLSRFEEEWARRGDPRQAVAIALRETGPGVVTGALTTAVAFYTTLLVEVDAFGELGLIAGTGLLLVMLAAFLLLPPLFLAWAALRARRQRAGKVVALAAPGRLFQRVVGRHILRYPVLVVVVGVLCTAFFLSRSRGIPFDYDLLKLLPEGTESVRYHHRLIETSNFSSEFNAVVVRSLAEVQSKTERLEHLKTVGRVESVAPLIPPEADTRTLSRVPVSREEALQAFVPPNQEEKIDILQKLSPLFKDLPQRYAKPPPVEGPALQESVARLAEAFERVLEAAPPKLTQPAAAVVAAVARLQKTLGAAGAQAVQRANDFQRQLFDRLGEGLSFLQRALRNPARLTAAELSHRSGGMLDRLVGRSGRYAIYAFPAGPIWDRNFLGAFVGETKQVDDEVTGFPINFYFFSERIQEGFRWATLYAAVVIFLLLLVEFRSLLYALLAAVPLFVGASWMLGWMGLLGVQYNPANVVALPLILGMGVEYGAEIVHRFAESPGEDLDRLLGTTVRAVSIAGLTTMLGLGSMWLAAHRGLGSLGLILVCGIGACLLTSVLILPSLLRIIARWRAAKGARASA